MSRASRPSASSRCSLGSKPSLPQSRALPTVSRTVWSSSPPRGTPSMTMLGTRRIRAASSTSAEAATACNSLTRSEVALAAATSSAFFSPLATATSLPNDFCSKRSDSNSAIDERRRSSAPRIASTIPSSSPRARCEARTASGWSRRNLISITGPSLSAQPTRHRTRSRRLAVHVVKVMGQVMQEVLTEGFHGESPAIGTSTSALPVVIAQRVERRRRSLGRRQELNADYLRFLRAVGAGDRRVVLVPVLNSRIHLGTHEIHPRLEHPTHVPDMAGVFQGRPHPWFWPDSGIDPGAHRGPACGILPQSCRNLPAGHGPRVESTVRTRLLQDPGPVLVVWLDLG